MEERKQFSVGKQVWVECCPLYRVVIIWNKICVSKEIQVFREFPNPDKPEKILQFLHISSTIKKNVGGCVHVTYR